VRAAFYLRNEEVKIAVGHGTFAVNGAWYPYVTQFALQRSLLSLCEGLDFGLGGIVEIPHALKADGVDVFGG
jgi:hypothetical protein